MPLNSVESVPIPYLESLPLSGYLIGYLVHRNKDLAPTCAPSAFRYEDIPHETGAAPLMDWDDVKKLLAQKLTTSSMDAVLG